MYCVQGMSTIESAAFGESHLDRSNTLLALRNLPETTLDDEQGHSGKSRPWFCGRSCGNKGWNMSAQLWSPDVR
jgi:hypothetical protein